MTLGEKIASFRKEKGWSQEELAARLFVTRQAVSKWERDLSIPELDTLKRLASEMGVGLSCLLSSNNKEDAKEERPLGFTDFRLPAIYLAMAIVVLAVGTALALLPEARGEPAYAVMAFLILGALLLEVVFLLIKASIPLKKVRLFYSGNGLRASTWKGEREIPFSSIVGAAAKTHGNWRVGKLVIKAEDTTITIESIRNVNDVKTIVDELLFAARN